MYKFQGKWITSAEFANIKPCDAYGIEPAKESSLQDAHILFRTTFSYNGEGDVRLYYSADDYCKVYVNGNYVSCGPAPSYPFHMAYVQFSIKKYLHKGENLIAFHTYYQGLVNRVWVSGDNRHGLLFDIAQNGKVLVCSNENVKVRRHSGWKISHIVGYDTQFIDDYDSRSTENGFEKIGYDDSLWSFAKEREFIDYRLYPSNIKQLTMETLDPVSKLLDNGNILYDFQQEFVGVPRLIAKGRAGDVVEIYCGEELNADGSVRYDMRCNCVYKEKWTLSGKEDVFEPFDYKAFRYMEIKKPNDCMLLSVKGIARHYPFALKEKCAFCDEPSNRIFDLCVQTLKYGIQEGYLDCPSREKGQYFGDGVWSAMAHILLTGDDSLYKKFIDDALNSSKIKAGGTAQGPCSYLQLIAEYPLMAVISLAYYQKLIGNERFIAKRKELIRSILTAYAENYADESGLVSVYDRWNVVDWPASARDGYDFDLTQGKIVHGRHNVMNAYWILALKAYEKLYGKADFIDVESVLKAYKKVFFDENTHCFKDSEVSTHCAIGSQVFGVLTGVVQDKLAEEILEEMILQKRLSASNLFITPVLFLWLKKTGRNELLKSLICDEKAWLNMLDEGATTTFEAFSKDGKWNTSLCHTMFAFPVLFMTEKEWV